MNLRDFIAAGIGVLTALGGAMWFTLTNFETVSAAEQKWAVHNQAITCKTVADLKAELRATKTRLDFDASLTEDQRRRLEENIRDIKAEIHRLDPNGVC